MSAIASDRADTAKGRLRPMREDDLEAVMEIEHRAYPFPWTHGIFRDCLRADYPAWILPADGRILGYGVLSVAADASPVLNICIDSHLQGQRLGPRLPCALLQPAGGHAPTRVFLVVRPPHPPARASSP